MAKTPTDVQVLDAYEITLGNLVTKIEIYREPSSFVATYRMSISNISPTTKIILEKIRKEFISSVTAGLGEAGTEQEGVDVIKTKFEQEIKLLIKKYFANLDATTMNVLVNYIIRQNLGLGDIEILLRDENLEEIVINSSQEPVWVYHRKHGWLQTNIYLDTESKTRHYATMIGRDVGKEITLLKPLMDAHLLTGDRVNATLHPISDRGNTITIRKFSEHPWTITDFIGAGTINYEGASLLWLAIENELSILVAGGTGSGKTSMLNVLANFFPPNHRIISIEDTRELTLPKALHWVPLATRLPNPEGKGGVSMLDLVVNSLRMRPDRIIVGEIRREAEAQVLFEAMHTGHSVYATIHANNAHETIDRLTNPPINVPKKVVSALGLILVQNRNRRTGKRRTLQIAEVTDEGDEYVFMQHDAAKDTLARIKDIKRVKETISLYTGMTDKQMQDDLKQKVTILQWLTKNDVRDVHKIGLVMAKYYTGQLDLSTLKPEDLET